MCTGIYVDTYKHTCTHILGKYFRDLKKFNESGVHAALSNWVTLDMNVPKMLSGSGLGCAPLVSFCNNVADYAVIPVCSRENGNQDSQFTSSQAPVARQYSKHT